MKAKNFPEANMKIAENQKEYETLPVLHQVQMGRNEKGELVPVMGRDIMCFELDEDEKKQIEETGCIWLTILRKPNAFFHPIGMSVLKPELEVK